MYVRSAGTRLRRMRRIPVQSAERPSQSLSGLVKTRRYLAVKKTEKIVYSNPKITITFTLNEVIRLHHFQRTVF